jgi:hypothetical protein
VSADLSRDGFVFVRAAEARALLGPPPGWDAFAASWARLEVDPYMADKGRYRRRRHAVYAVDGDAVVRQPARPHYQSLEYNPLHGGIERRLAQVEGDPEALRAAIARGAALFGGGRWSVEAHQFRIEARAGEPGKPTPEGMHRDGVDFVLVLLVRRENVRSGTTTIRDEKTGRESAFTLAEPFDCALVDDARVRHGVTAVEPVDPARPAYRDVLVVTYKRA